MSLKWSLPTKTVLAFLISPTCVTRTPIPSYIISSP
jgi:hypothetical protein